MRKIIFIPCLLLLATLLSAAQKSLDQLKSEAEHATGAHQAQLYAELARQLVDVADQQFSDGKSRDGQATVQQVLDSATKARDIAIEHHGKLKEVEISLRETQRRVDSLKRTLDVEDRPPLDALEKKIAQYRQDLLDAMFAPRHKEKKP